MSSPVNRSYHRDEGSGEKLDRRWHELLQELRLAQTGTQVFFAFLLGIGFQNQFHSADRFTHDVYAGTLITGALAVACFLAPVAFHRIVYRQGLRDRLLKAADRLTRAGLTFLVAATAGGVLLALDIVLARRTAILIVAVVTACFLILWLAVPLSVRRPRRTQP